MVALTKEDLGRNKSYAARAQVVQAQARTTDMESFLRELAPVATVEPFSAQSSERIAQLLAKTNQFKLNAQHVPTAKELAQSDYEVIAVSFADRLQGYGIVSVSLVATRGDDLELANWVMSCRVFSRRLEFAVMDLVREHARRHAARRIVARFTATGKNQVAREHLLSVGFSEDAHGTLWAPVERPADQPDHYMSFNSR
jgi:FkbH-like protein